MRSLVNIFTSHDDSLSLYTRNSQIRQEKVVHIHMCVFAEERGSVCEDSKPEKFSWRDLQAKKQEETTGHC